MRSTPMKRWAIAAAAVVLAVAANAANASARPTQFTGNDYVALGDSAAAAPFVPGYDTRAPGCLRSTENYPAAFARTSHIANYVDVTCTSAQSVDVVSRSQRTASGPQAPQISAVGPHTKLITITIGGNDVQLVTLALSCVAVRPPNSGTPPCRSRFVTNGVDTVSRAIQHNRGQWTSLIRSLKAKAPLARIVVVSYGTYIRPGGCLASQPLYPVDADYLQAKVNELDDTQAQVAAAEKVDFFDTRPITRGHDACAPPAQRYLEGIVPSHIALPLHPNGPGSSAIGTALARYVAAAR